MKPNESVNKTIAIINRYIEETERDFKSTASCLCCISYGAQRDFFISHISFTGEKTFLFQLKSELESLLMYDGDESKKPKVTPENQTNCVLKFIEAALANTILSSKCRAYLRDVHYSISAVENSEMFFSKIRTDLFFPQPVDIVEEDAAAYPIQIFTQHHPY